MQEEGNLRGVVLTHIDDFNIAGDDDFVEKIFDHVERKHTISKVKRDRFCFTGVDVAALGDGIGVLMDDYIQSLKDIKDIRMAEQDEELSRVEMKEY